MSRRVLGLDVGGETTRFVEGQLKGGAFEILRAQTVPSADLGAALAERGLRGLPAVVGVTGRDMILRTTFVPPVPEWQLRELMSFEVAEIAEQSGDALVADWGVLGGAAAGGDEDLVLLALVRATLIEERSAELSAAGLKLQGFTPNAVGLHNAVAATDGGEGTLLVAALRGRNTDLAIVQDGELVFARNLSGGGDAFTDALAEALGISKSQADELKAKEGALPAPGEPRSGQRAAVAAALEGALRPIVGMLQSTLSLCRSQLKAPDFEVQRVLLCGPGAALPGLDQALTRALGLPVSAFDPTEGYLVGELEPGARGSDFAVATGLAMMALLDGAFRIEVLPPALQRARAFRQRTLWLVLAGAVVLLHLLGFGWLSHSHAQAARQDELRLRREAQLRQADRATFERAAGQAAALAEALTRIEEVTAPGSGLLTVMALLDAHLPDELWITAVRTVRAAEPGFPAWEGLSRPFVVVEGEGKEQERDLSRAVSELTERLRQHEDVAGVVMTYTPDARGRFRFELRIDTSVRPAAPVAGEAPAAAG